MVMDEKECVTALESARHRHGDGLGGLFDVRFVKYQESISLIEPILSCINRLQSLGLSPPKL
jgi:hypothetical protein